MAGRILQRCCRYIIRNVMYFPNYIEPVLIINHNTTFKRWRFGFPKLTPQQVNTILKAHEHNAEIENPAGAVVAFDTNQLPSNNPIEDRRSEARCVLTTGLMFGIFDGHAGSACADIVSQRLFYYLAASFLPRELLRDYMTALSKSREKEEYDADLIRMYNKEMVFTSELSKLYHRHFIEFVKELLDNDSREFVTEKAIIRAFERLDSDISKEAQITEAQSIRQDLLSVAASGCVACVAHVDGPHLHIANVGDCQAVLGVLDENKTWTANVLNKEHNYQNMDEVKRILNEHPSNEKETVLKHDRLLGQLAPLRAFGDYRYKWNVDLQKKHFVPLFGHQCLAPNYHTPPYLTASPEITYHRLMPRDKFLVIASDGLWEQISPHKVVQLVGEYMSGKQTLDKLKLPNKNMKLKEINDILQQRREGLKNKPIDTNAATHLIRNALGGTEYGIEHSMLSQMLSVPDDVIRLIRDDITITVIFFNTEYLRHCPA